VRRAGRAALVVLAGAAVLAGLGRGSAGAAPVTAVGWWTTARVDGTPVGLGAAVADGAVQVAYGADRPISVAAVRFTAGSAGGATLVLALDASSTPLPFTVVACPITVPWQHVNGGALADAPTWDCALGTTSSSYDPTAKTLTWGFDGAFVRDGTVDVALLPIQGSQPFSATTTPPGDQAVTPAGSPPADPPAPAASDATPPTTASAPQSEARSTVEPGAGVEPAPAPATDPTTVPVVVAAPADQLPAALPTTAQARPAVVRSREGSSAARAFGIAVLLAVAAAVVVLASGRPRRVTGTGDEGTARGVGRFRSPRDAPPEAV
jgi:hypothetical protein